MTGEEWLKKTKDQAGRTSNLFEKSTEDLVRDHKD